MPRVRRTKSFTGIYHVIMRGVSLQDIFYEGYDYRHFIQIVMREKEKYGFKIYAYCMMPNHIHLLIQDVEENISQIMQSINTSYSTWFNIRHQRHGHLFQDRFLSKPVEDKQYFLQLIKYIHLNPYKAGILEMNEEYPYSSHANYENNNLIDSDILFRMIDKNSYGDLHGMDCCEEKYEMIRIRLTDEEARKIVLREIDLDNPLYFCHKSELEQMQMIKICVQKGINMAQFARIVALPHQRIKYLKRKSERVLTS